MANNVQTYGFMRLENILADKVTTINAGIVNDAIGESLAEYNRQKSGILGMFSRQTTLYTEKYWVPGTGTLQPLDVDGNMSPSVTQETGSQSVAYPIHGAGDSFGFNRVSRAKATIEDVDRQLAAVMRKDADWVRRHMLAAVLDNVNWTFTDSQFGAVTVKALANTDGSAYVRVGGSAPTDDEHYLYTSGSGTETDLDTIYDELSEHPSNGYGPFVVFVPSANVAYMTSTTNNPNYVAASIPGITAASTTAVFNADQERYRGPGDLVLGQDGRIVLVEWRALPTDYLIGVALDTDPPLAQREHPEAELQGLFEEPHSPDGNLDERRFIRYCGFGVRNRISACVMKLGAQSYSIPTGYDAPLSV